jgi:hypothetical protein
MSRARKIEPGDITPAEAGAAMGLTLAQFNHCLPGLLDRGFPPPDPTTGNYALDAISVWRRSRFPRIFPNTPNLTVVPKPRDARERLRENGNR